MTTKQILWRGLRLRCPQCGEGKLFQSYLKPQDQCPHCQEPLGHIRADDGPAWLSIFITGHIAVALILHLEQYDLLTFLVEIAVIVLTVLSSIFFFLPRSKGLFIAAIWLSNQKKNT